MDKNNPKKSIISFTKSYDYCYDKAEEYFQAEAFDDALQEANNAYAIESTSEVLLLIAEIFAEKECYDLSFTCACRVLGMGNLDSEMRERLFMLIPRVLLEQGQHYASVFYVLRNSPAISEALSKIVPPDQTLDTMLGDAMKDFIEDDMQPSYFSTSEEKREEYNEETLTRAMKLVDQGEFSDAKYLVMSLYDTGSQKYKDGRKVLAYIYAAQNESDKAVDILYDEYKKDKTDSSWIFSVENLGDKYKILVKQMLDEFEPSKKKKSMFEAISICCQNGYDDLAYDFAYKLSEFFPEDVKCNMLKILANWNLENNEEVKKEFFGLLYTARAYYPIKYISKLRFPKRFDLSFQDLPFELVEKLKRSVIIALKKYEKGEDYSELLNAVIFILRNVLDEDIETFAVFFESIERIGGDFMLDLYKQVATSPKVPVELQKYVIRKLVHIYRKGFIFYNNESFIMEIELRVPPSYEAFSPRLQEAFRKGFSLIAEFDNKFDKDYCEVFEKVFLKDIDAFFPKKSDISMIVVYYLVKKKAPDILEDFCTNMGLDYALYQRNADKLHRLLTED